MDNLVLVKKEGWKRFYACWPAVADFVISADPVTSFEYGDVVDGIVGDAATRTTCKRATWAEAVRYCNLLNRRHGLPPPYDEATGQLLDEHGAPLEDVLETSGFRVPAEKVKGYRLPTLAEWQAAAMGFHHKEGGFYLDILHETFHIWGMSNGPAPDETRAELDRLVTNPIGVRGLLGNGTEWCTDNLNAGVSRNRVCFWRDYFANYDNAISFDVRTDMGGDSDVHRFHVVQSLGA